MIGCLKLILDRKLAVLYDHDDILLCYILHNSINTRHHNTILLSLPLADSPRHHFSQIITILTRIALPPQAPSHFEHNSHQVLGQCRPQSCPRKHSPEVVRSFHILHTSLHPSLVISRARRSELIVPENEGVNWLLLTLEKVATVQAKQYQNECLKEFVDTRSPGQLPAGAKQPPRFCHLDKAKKQAYVDHCFAKDLV
jgi:hypothetical protein